MNLSHSEAAARWALRTVWIVGGLSVSIGLWPRVSRAWSIRPRAAARHGDPARLRQRFLLASRVAGLFAVCVGLAVFLGGWCYNISVFKSLLPGTQTMKANTTLGLMLLGTALGLNGLSRFKAAAQAFARTVAGLAALIGGLSCLEYVTGWNFHIDQLLFRDSNAPVPFNPPGRMAFTTALSLFFLGCAFLLSKHRRGVMLGQCFAAAVSGLCFLNLVGYVYGIQNYHAIVFYAGVALHTSLTLLLLSLGVLFANVTEGWMATVGSERLGGVMARRLLPAAVLVPVGLGWLRWQGQQRGYYDHAFGFAMSTSASVAVFLLLIWANSRLLNRLDQERVESYDSLRESEISFRQLADSMPQMVWTTRADGWLDYCNQRWTDHTGLTVVQTQGWGSLAVIHPDDVARVVDAWNRAIETGVACETEFRLKRASDGAYRWHLGRGVAMRDETGRIVKWFGTSTDINDYKRAQQALEEARQQLEVRVQERTAELEQSNNLLNAILDSMGDGVICVNEKYEHVLFNNAARKFLGSGPVQTQPDQRAQVYGIYHPDKRTLFKREELPLGRALRGENCDNLEMYGHHPEQKAGIWLSASSRPVKDSCGKLYGAVLVLRDVTEKKRAEEVQSRLLTILEETSDFVGTARLDGTIFYANRALRALRGVGEESSIEGMRIDGTYPQRVVEQTLNEAIAVALKHGRWRGENVFQYHSGEEIPVSQIIMSHRNRDGEVEFMSTIARDISELKDNEAKLQLMQKQLEASLAKERALSRSDVLTALPNRRAFLEIAEIEKERSRRYSHCFSLAYLDLDGFKKVNDTLGHSAGDQVLVTVAKVLRANLRTSDTVARLGGDEFAILLPETDPASARKVITKMQDLLRTAMKAGRWDVDFSIGLASFLDPPSSIDYIIRSADELMYSVKANGKGDLAAAIMG